MSTSRSAVRWAPGLLGLVFGAAALLLCMAPARSEVASDAERAESAPHAVARRTVPLDTVPLDSVPIHTDFVLEPEDGRRIARLEFHRRGAQLFLRIRATGPLLEDVPGYEAVPHTNRRTAEELTAGFDEGRLTARLVGVDGRARSLGLVPESRERLPRRYLDEHGVLRLDGQAEVATLNSVRTSAFVPGRGTTRVEIHFGGECRLVCRLHNARGALRFDDARSMGGWHRPAVRGVR